MATEILHPQDCLRFSPPSFSPRRKPYHGNYSNSNPKSCRKQAKRSSPSPPPQATSNRPLISKKSTAAPAPAKNFVLGQVTILKRGEPLKDENLKKSFSGDFSKKGNDNLKKTFSDGDLVVCGTDRLGPDPKQVQVRLTDLKTDVYAGSAFAHSPSPRALPLPKFSMKKSGGTSAVDDSATKDLRRLLRIG